MASPAFIIHANDSIDRKDLVEKIISLTGAIVSPATILKNRNEGCHMSHLTIYKSVDTDFMVFEDDCEILDESFLNLLSMSSSYDMIYFGINYYLQKGGSYGTHAIWISNHARKCFIENDGDKTCPIDHMWNHVEAKYNLKVWRPVPKDRFVRQKIGLKSLITGSIRGKC